MTLKGWNGETNCEYALDLVGAPQTAAAPPPPVPPPPAAAPPVAPVRPPVAAVPAVPAVPAPAPDPQRTAFIGQPPQEIASVQRALAALGHYRGALDGAYGPGTAAAIEAWQRSQAMPPTGFLNPPDSDRLKQQALALLGAPAQAPPPAPSNSPPASSPIPQVADPAPGRIEWDALLGTWIPKRAFTAERCSGNSPYPSDSIITLSQSGMAIYEGGCDFVEKVRTSSSMFRVTMGCGETNDRSERRVRTIGMANGTLSIDGEPYVRCTPAGASGPPAGNPPKAASAAPQRQAAAPAKPADGDGAMIKNLAVFQGSCRLLIRETFTACDPKVAFAERRDGRSTVVFTAGDAMFTLSGGRDRQPNPENYYLGVDRLRFQLLSKKITEDSQLEGECHFHLNKDASKFHSIKCDVFNRTHNVRQSLYLENIRTFDRKSF